MNAAVFLYSDLLEENSVKIKTKEKQEVVLEEVVLEEVVLEENSVKIKTEEKNEIIEAHNNIVGTVDIVTSTSLEETLNKTD